MSSVKNHRVPRLQLRVAALLLLLGSVFLITEKSEAAKVLCDGKLIRKQQLLGSYKLSLTYRMPKGGNDRNSKGTGNIVIRNQSNGRLAKTNLNCQMDLDVPGGLICTSDSNRSSIEQAITVEVQPTKDSRNQEFRIFVGAWDAKAASVVHRLLDCKSSGL